jgi:hypothetical protein
MRGAEPTDRSIRGQPRRRKARSRSPAARAGWLWRTGWGISLDRANPKPDVQHRRPDQRFPQSGQEIRFLEGCQFCEQGRVGNRHTQDASTETINPGMATPRLTDRVGPGGLQGPGRLHPRQTSRGEQIPQDIRKRLRSPGSVPRVSPLRRGPTPTVRPRLRPLRIATVEPSAQVMRPFILTTRSPGSNLMITRGMDSISE